MKRWTVVSTLALAAAALVVSLEAVHIGNLDRERSAEAAHLAVVLHQEKQTVTKLASKQKHLVGLHREMADLQARNRRLLNENSSYLFGPMSFKAHMWGEISKFFRQAGITAICRDYTFSYARQTQGQCSHHRGIGILVTIPIP
jgi:hypothetical protein